MIPVDGDADILERMRKTWAEEGCRLLSGPKVPTLGQARDAAHRALLLPLLALNLSHMSRVLGVPTARKYLRSKMTELGLYDRHKRLRSHDEEAP